MLQNAVAMTTTTTGLGAYDLLPLTGDIAPLFSTFVEAFGSGEKVPYRVEMAPDWEEGYGVVTAGDPVTLTREVTRSSNGGAAVNWPAGTKMVVQHFPADPLRFGAIGSVPTATGTGDEPEIAHVPPLLALRPGMRGSFYASASNTGDVTLEIDDLGPLPLRRADGEEIGHGVIRAGGLVKWYAHSASELRLDEDMSGWVRLGSIDLAGDDYRGIAVPPGLYQRLQAVVSAAECSGAASQTIGIRLSVDGSYVTTGYDHTQISASANSGSPSVGADASSSAGWATLGICNSDSIAGNTVAGTCDIDIMGSRALFKTSSTFYLNSPANLTNYLDSCVLALSGDVDGVFVQNVTSGTNFTAGRLTLLGLKL